MNRDRFVRCYYVVVFVILDSFMVNDTDKDILKLYKSIKKPRGFYQGFQVIIQYFTSFLDAGFVPVDRPATSPIHAML